jgi:8-oxo-dGTP pyrophosphatase MutT (NUDIX family)
VPLFRNVTTTRRNESPDTNVSDILRELPHESAVPESSSIKHKRDASEELKLKARKLRFTHPPVPDNTEPMVEIKPEASELSTPLPRGVTAVFAHDTGEHTFILGVTERYGDHADKMVTPGGKIEPGEAPKQAMVRECQEEVAPAFGDALRRLGALPDHCTTFRGTWIYFVPASHYLFQEPFAPTQSPPETEGLAWFNLLDLQPRSQNAAHSAEDTKGEWHEISRYMLGVVAAVVKAGDLPEAPSKAAPSEDKLQSKAPLARTPQAARPASTVRRPISKSACTAGLAILAAAAADADGILPLMGQPPKYNNEIILPPSSNFEWPVFDHVCLHEHTGAFLLANAERGATACSVADRRSTRPPPPGCYAFLGKVDHFLELYPHPIGRVTSHVTCAPACYANWHNWSENVRDGTILQAARDVLLYRSIGNRAAAEQPPSCIARLLGEPTFKTTAEQLGGRMHKSLWFWTRNLDAVSPTVTNPEGVLNMLTQARSGTPEETMLRRSAFELEVARSLMDVWAKQDPWEGFTPRPAAQPCDEHPVCALQLHHNYSIFAARYAPQLTESQINAAGDADVVVVVPITTVNDRQCVLWPLTASAFASIKKESTSILDHAKEICVFVGGAEPMLACPLKTRLNTVYVFAVPFDIQPMVLLSPAEISEAIEDGAEAVWCHTSNAAALPGHIYIYAACTRLKEMQGCTTQAEIIIGSRGKAAPAIVNKSSTAWNTKAAAALEVSQTERHEFIKRDEAICAEFRKALTAVDNGDGTCAQFALMVRGARDVQHELPATPQLLPEFNDSCLRLALMPQRPPPLTTEWLVDIPQQQVPNGVGALSWRDIIRRFGRVLICNTINANATYDLACVKTGEGNGRRAPFLALDDRVAKQIIHQDGIGSWNAFDIIWERRGDGMYVPMDFLKAYAEHKNLDFLRKLFRNITDQELLSILFQGMRYKAAWPGEPPRQIRISHNVQSSDTRMKGIAAVMLEHIALGITEVIKLFRAETETLSPDDHRGPLINIPTYVVGIGGADKPDSPGPEGEKRKIGNSTEPHGEVKARGAPHGEPDGDTVVNFNDLTGPAKPPPGYSGPPLPWPDPETKRGTRHTYKANALMLHMAQIAGHPCVGAKDDVRWMFWQFWLSRSEYWLVAGLMILLIEGVLWVCATRDCVMTMGVRPASKVACRFIEEFVEAANIELDVWIKSFWVPKQNQALKALLAEREAKLGALQARPYYRSPFTDDIFQNYIGTEMAAMGVYLLRRQCNNARLRMSSKVGAGTVIDYVGARHMLSGGFGCLTPVKRARALFECTRAMGGNSTLDQLISTNSYLSHVADVVDLRANSLTGVRGPVTKAERLEAHGDTLIQVHGFRAMEVYKDIKDQLHDRCAASFMCAIRDTPSIEGAMRIVCGSDSCSDVKVPYICGGAGGYFWRHKLSERWLRQHITLTEGLGLSFNTVILPPLFPDVQLMYTTDSDAGVATQLGKARSPKLQILAKNQKRCKTFIDSAHRSWFGHVPGIYNNLYDLGSRDRMQEMYMLAAAFGVTLTEVPVTQEAINLADAVIEEVEASPEVHESELKSLEKRVKRKSKWSRTRSTPRASAAAFAAFMGPATSEALATGQLPLVSANEWSPLALAAALFFTVILLGALVASRPRRHASTPPSPPPSPPKSTPPSSPLKRARYIVPDPSPPSTPLPSERVPDSSLGWYVISDGNDVRMHQWDVNTPHDAQCQKEFIDAGYKIFQCGADFAAARTKRDKLRLHADRAELRAAKRFVATTSAPPPSAPPSPPDPPISNSDSGSDGTTETQEGDWQTQTWGVCACANCVRVIPGCEAWCDDCIDGGGLLCECASCGACNCCCSCPPDYPKQFCACTTCVQICYGDETRCDSCFEHDRAHCKCDQCGQCDCCCNCEPTDAHNPLEESPCDRCGNCDCCCNCDSWDSGLSGPRPSTPPMSSSTGPSTSQARMEPSAEELAAGYFVRHNQSLGPANSKDPWATSTAHATQAAVARNGWCTSDWRPGIDSHKRGLPWAAGCSADDDPREDVVLPEDCPHFKVHESDTHGEASAPVTTLSVDNPFCFAHYEGDATGADDGGKTCTDCDDQPAPPPETRAVAKGISGLRNALLMLGASRASATANSPSLPAEVSQVDAATLFATMLLIAVGAAVLWLSWNILNDVVPQEPPADHQRLIRCDCVALRDVPAEELLQDEYDSGSEDMPGLIDASTTDSDHSYHAPHRDFIAKRLRGGGLAEPESPPSLIGVVAPTPLVPAIQLPQAQIQHCAPVKLDSTSTEVEPESPPALLNPSMAMASTSDALAVEDNVESPPQAPGSASKREPHSPQPRSARQARQRAAAEQAEHLVNDSSAYALSPNNPGALRSMVVEAAEIRDDGIPHGTRKQDETGFNAVKKFCESIDTPHMRPRLGAPDFDEAREMLFYALAIVAVALAIKPGKHSAEKGMKTGKPSTALNYIYAFKRVLFDCGRWVPTNMSGVLKQLKGLNARVRASFGQDCLIPHQTQPFSLAMLRTMAKALRDKVIKKWTSCTHTVMLVMICYCLSTGTRCDEMAQAFQDTRDKPGTRSKPDDSDNDYLRRVNFTPFRNAMELKPTKDAWQSMVNGDLIRAHCAPSKCDRDNVTFGRVKQWFRYDDTNPLNFAAAWAAYEIEYPCPLDQRETWPAFSPTGDATPFTCTGLRALLEVLMLATIGKAEAALRSWHAFRVTIACCLMARPEYKQNPSAQVALIQMLVRWKTPESVTRYAKCLPTHYADHVDQVTTTDGHPCANMRHEVTIDPTSGYEDIEAAIAELEAKLVSSKRKSMSEPPESDNLIVEMVTDPTGTGETATQETEVEPEAEVEPAAPSIYNCPVVGDVTVGDKDPRNIVGTSVLAPNKLWAGYENDNGKAECLIVGYSKSTQVPNAKKPGAYVVKTEGEHFALDAAYHIFKSSKGKKK